MLEKKNLLALVSVVATLALPTAAPASWKHHNTFIAESVTLNVDGKVWFQGGLGGIECQILSRVRFDPGTTGSVTSFWTNPGSATTECFGLGGLKPCQVHSLSPQAPNWTVHTNESVVSVTTTNITGQLTGGIFCLVKNINLTGGTVSFNPNQPNTVSGGTLSGGLQADIQTNSGTVDWENVTVGGILNLGSSSANTYSI
jgi:hypothetical protein